MIFHLYVTLPCTENRKQCKKPDFNKLLLADFTSSTSHFLKKSDILQIKIFMFCSHNLFFFCLNTFYHTWVTRIKPKNRLKSSSRTCFTLSWQPLSSFCQNFHIFKNINCILTMKKFNFFQLSFLYHTTIRRSIEKYLV